MDKKEFSDMTYDELMQLPEAEFIERERVKERKRLTSISAISNPDYAKYTFDEKVRYWAYNINQQMRWQAESGLDPYAGFSQDWYEAMKRIEPDFDAIMDAAFTTSLSWEWDKAEYLKRIQQPI